MLKYLVVIGVIAFIYFFFIKKKPIANSSSHDAPSSGSDMVECSTCGTYAQIDDSILSNGKYYCSQECLKESK